jgi:hypothetical protein
LAELASAVALLGVAVGLSGGLAYAYYSWLHSYAIEGNVMLSGLSDSINSHVAVVAEEFVNGSKVWIFNYGRQELTISRVYLDGSLLADGWEVVDASSHRRVEGFTPGRLSVFIAPASTSVVIYFSNQLRLEVRGRP